MRSGRLGCVHPGKRLAVGGKAAKARPEDVRTLPPLASRAGGSSRARAGSRDRGGRAAPPRLRARQHVLHAAMPCDPHAYRRPFGVIAGRRG